MPDITLDAFITFSLTPLTTEKKYYFTLFTDKLTKLRKSYN